ncbi:MAG TPA: 50S ribosomal protein L11 methyltransferase [Polyangiaceae bacterium]
MPFRVIDLPPYWRILPPNVPADSAGPSQALSLVRLESGRGFGTGSHETTQLCMLALGHWLRAGPTPQRVLDFGAGSGILAIAAALAGARVLAVEIDEPSIAHAHQNAVLNGVEQRIEFRTHLGEEDPPFDLIFANVLKQVLLDYAEPISKRLSERGKLILSGLFATDIPAILGRYRPLLPSMIGEVFERGDWRALTFRPAS